MRIRSTCLTVLTLAFALPAQAREASGEYGSAGQLEAGGSFAIASIRTELDDAGAERSATAIILSPIVGYYVAPGFELIGQLGVASVTGTENDGAGNEADVTLTSISLAAGAGYFLPIGGARVGPQLLLRFANETIGFEFGGGEIEITSQNVGAEAGVFAKVPVGGGGVITAGIAAQFANLTQEVEFGGVSGDADGTGFGLQTSVGFLVFF